MKMYTCENYSVLDATIKNNMMICECWYKKEISNFVHTKSILYKHKEKLLD